MSEKMYTKEDMIDFTKWYSDREIITYDNLKAWEKRKNSNVWTPKESEEYYFIDNLLMFDKTFYSTQSYRDEIRIKNNNCFKTIAQCSKVPIQLFVAIWKWKLDNDDVELDWKDQNDKFAIMYNESINKIDVLGYWTSHNLLTPYFSTKEKAEACLKWLKKEGLLNE